MMFSLLHGSSNRAAVAPEIESRIEPNTLRFQCPNTGREIDSGINKPWSTRLISIRVRCPICQSFHDWQVADATPGTVLPADRRSNDAQLTKARSALQDFQGRSTQVDDLREQLLDELNHRLKNNLQILHGLLLIALHKTDNSEAREVLSSRRIGAMGTAQQIFYSVHDSTDISGPRLIEAVCANARAFLSKEVSINCEATTGSLPKESAVPLALVDDKGIVIFDPAKVVTLLTEKGTEAFEGERAIRLFQFLTWILFPQMPETKYVKWAGLMATVKFLDRMEEWHFMDKESTRLRNEGEETTVDLDTKPPQTISRIATLRQDNSAYRRVYDLMIGKRGGLLGLLDTPSPASFDHAVRERIDRMHIISNLIDCRLRYIQHGCGGARGADNRDGANHNHAMFFCWWPTHSIKGRRGKTSPDKSASIRTMRTWWKKLATSAFFVYLNDTHGFKQLPPTTDDDFFVDELLRLSNDTAELKRFFGAYLYLTNTFREAGGDFAYVPVPASIKPVSISTSRFSKTELETISHYDEHYLSMND